MVDRYILELNAEEKDLIESALYHFGDILDAREDTHGMDVSAGISDRLEALQPVQG